MDQAQGEAKAEELTRSFSFVVPLYSLLLGLLGWSLGVVLGAPASRWLVEFLGSTLIPLDYALPAAGVRACASTIAAPRSVSRTKS